MSLTKAPCKAAPKKGSSNSSAGISVASGIFPNSRATSSPVYAFLITLGRLTAKSNVLSIMPSSGTGFLVTISVSST